MNTLDDATVNLSGFTLEEVNAFRVKINGHLRSMRGALACLWAWPLLCWGFFVYNNYNKNTFDTSSLLLLVLFTGVGLLSIALHKMNLVLRLWLSFMAFLFLIVSDWLSWETGVFDEGFWCMGVHSIFAAGEAIVGYVNLNTLLKKEEGNLDVTLSAHDRARIKEIKRLDLLD